jgi:curli production assembly/transport component CsgF
MIFQPSIGISVMRTNTLTHATVAALTLMVSCSGAIATEMVYHPVNPSFGGNPLNGTFLLQQAQAQGEGTKSGAQTPDLSGLNDALSNLGSGAVIIGGNGNNSSGNGNSGNGNGGTNNPPTSNAARANTVRSLVP